MGPVKRNHRNKNQMFSWHIYKINRKRYRRNSWFRRLPSTTKKDFSLWLWWT